MCQRKYAVAVGSGSSALEFVYRALKYGNPHATSYDKKIIIPAQSFVATLNSVINAGFEPSFCDVDRITGLLDPINIDQSIDSVGALTTVNLFGNVVDYGKLKTYQLFKKNNVPIVEDAAQSFGAYYQDIPSGKLGDVSCLSFDPTKNLSCYGSGGMVLTDTAWIAGAILDLRDNGKCSDHHAAGSNSKMSEVECAQLLVKLRYFDQWQRRRQEIAKYYIDQLNELVTIPKIEDHVVSSWSKFVVHLPNLVKRSGFNLYLDSVGIETKIHYKTPLHLQPVVYHRGLVHLSLAGAEKFSETCVSLPIYPELNDSEVERIVDSIIDYLKAS